ncbi:hypothetical protein BDD12DRAFT_824541 [Trichophaea hybrida]|nr:hypothetical protein BDD12DRAFT_824541 [Trichophaea hybrida]
MSYFKITLIRSGIGMTKRQNGVLAALIMKVKELVAVSTHEKPETKADIHRRRQPPSGFVVEN